MIESALLSRSHLTLATASELQYAQMLRQEVAPVLAKGVARALVERPADPASFMGEFVAQSQPGDAQLADALQRRRLLEEAAHLEMQLVQIQADVGAARQHIAGSGGSSGGSSGLSPAASGALDEAVADASWNEIRRLKRLMRAMKVRVSAPLVADDWLMPEGIVVVLSPPQVAEARKLCAQLASDFEVGHLFHDAPADGPSSLTVPPTLNVSALQIRDDQLNISIPDEKDEAGGAPPSLDLAAISADLADRAVQIVKGSATALLQAPMPPAEMHHLISSLTQRGLAVRALVVLTSQANGEEWARSVERAARESSLRLVPVVCDGSFEEQLTNFLCALVAL